MSRQDGKVFIGGLSWETTDEKLKRYFENYGTVQEAFVSYDRHTGRPRGFGFVIFADPVIADKVVLQQHTIDRREVEAKKALPKEESPISKDQQAVASGQRTKKIFVGGLAATVDEENFREYFEEFGAVEDAVVMYDHDNRRPRGFGFITFADEESVDKVFVNGPIQVIHEKQVEIKRAVPRDSMPPSPRAVFRSPHPHGPPSPYMEPRSPYQGGRGGGYGPPRGDRGGGSGYASPHHQGYNGGGRGRGERSPQGGQTPYNPPAVVTGIPAAMAAAAGQMGDGGVSPGAVLSNAGMVALQSGVNPDALQSPPHMVGSFSLQNGMQAAAAAAAAAAGQMAVVGSPPYSAQQAQQQQQAGPAPNLADVQQQLSLTSVSDALEQLQQQQQQQQQQAAQHAQAQQQGQTPTTIWS